MNLDTTSKSLQMVLAATVASNQLTWTANWTDVSGGPGSGNGNSNNTTPVTIVAAPGASVTRTINAINVYNADTAAATVTISLNNNSTLTTLTTITLQPGQTMKFDGSVWSVLESSLSAQYSSTTNPAGDAGGNLSGKYPNPTVSVLNGISAPPTAPSAGQILTATSNSTSAWQAAGGASGIASLSGAHFTGPYAPAVVALTDAANISVDASQGNVFKVTLGGNRTLSNPTNATNGQTIRVLVKQDVTGSRTLGYGSAYKFPTVQPSYTPQPTLSTAANSTDWLSFIYNGSSSQWLFMGIMKGF